MKNSITLKSEELYLAIYDQQSPANIAGIWDQMLERAKQLARDQPTGLFHFNQCWKEFNESAALLAWVLMFDGVYRIDIEDLSQEPAFLSEGDMREAFVGSTPAGATIEFPSGRIIVGNLLALGNSAPISFTVSPGLYEIQLVGNEDEQQKHMFLDNAADYPKEDGPDWILFLIRIGN